MTTRTYRNPDKPVTDFPNGVQVIVEQTGVGPYAYHLLLPLQPTGIDPYVVTRDGIQFVEDPDVDGMHKAEALARSTGYDTATEINGRRAWTWHQPSP